MIDNNFLKGTLYHPSFEKDSCGFGLIANMKNQPSHWLVQTAIESLTRLAHRGAIAQDGKTGDGCGLLFKKPDHFLRSVAEENGLVLTELYAVGQIFINQDESLASESLLILKAELEKEGFSVAGFRNVPINPEACGEQALKTLPGVVQIFVNAPEEMNEETSDRYLFIARRRAEKKIGIKDSMFYISSLSCRVLVYKGMIMPVNLPLFYPDLTDERFTSSLCLYHQRFSTNTWPEWRLAQPFRYLAHNGEINTIQGNRNWSVSRGYLFTSPLIPDAEEILPLVSLTGSDSMALDNVLESLVAGGMDIRLAVRILIPPAWQNMDAMEPDLRALYEYYSLHMDPWDGPAGIVLTDGRLALCAMDRNGLRPARYVITDDDYLTIASETGVYDYEPERVIAKGRLGPGEMISLDVETGEFSKSDDIDNFLRNRRPYKQWVDRCTRYLKTKKDEDLITPVKSDILRIYKKEFQVTAEEEEQILQVLAETGQEPVASMGDDAVLPVLSTMVRSFYSYFRQQFAQVTNPPIDSIRELTVMSLRTCFGQEASPLEEMPEHASRIDIYSPVLSHNLFSQILKIDDPEFSHQVIDLTYPITENLESAIERVCNEAENAVNSGKVILILSDEKIAKDRIPIHALLATGAVHHHLSQKRLRCKANIVVQTATARDPHHFAVLIGFGATAVYPYLAYQCLYDMTQRKKIRDKNTSELMYSYRRSINKGLFKILSKMGISTINSYRGAQLFETIGLHNNIVDLCFLGTINRIQGADFEDLENDQRILHQEAWNPAKVPQQGGVLKFTPDGEYHAFNPEVVSTLHKAVQSGDYSDYQLFADLVNNRPPTNLRDMLALQLSNSPFPLDEVESVEDILRRFDSAAMSLGSLSPEAHESIAVAMNHLGGRSNSGEGGEDSSRYGTDRVSKIKQVASGRFGVTPYYLVNAEVLQIKIAQGAKPGEGGQLPGHKVTELIAKLRCTLPGTPLISPPPHHDIYSIEDLAQLIFDLKQVNPEALVSVKLVSEAGVGTVAAGVAKTYADFITIAGNDGGTGASPISSVRYAGIPWEIGLSETHQLLRANNLRDKVRLQADGGLKTGLDVIKAAILGAESFAFGTAPLISLGCKYLRICHLNNCATGIATQELVLRQKHFQGSPERVENYFRFVATEVRHWLAALGVQKLTDIIGRTELLKQIEGNTEKQKRLNLTPLLALPDVFEDIPQFCTISRNEPSDRGVLAEKMVSDTRYAIKHQTGGIFSYRINNTHRSIGARLSGEIARRYGDQGMMDFPLTIYLSGTAGQSLGAWNVAGLHLILEGDANDYVGKGMAGGKIVLYPPRNSRFESHKTPIMGNTCLYGATGGRLFAAGRAGERFAVRNSGAIAVVEGIGDHGCEYMTGGVVVVLGPTGYNFGAGMTGGFAYILDSEGLFVDRYNHELVDIHRIHTENREEYTIHLHNLIETFVTETGSAWGEEVLANFTRIVNKFWLVKPKATEIDMLLDLINRAA